MEDWNGELLLFQGAGNGGLERGRSPLPWLQEVEEPSRGAGENFGCRRWKNYLGCRRENGGLERGGAPFL